MEFEHFIQKNSEKFRNVYTKFQNHSNLTRQKHYIDTEEHFLLIDNRYRLSFICRIGSSTNGHTIISRAPRINTQHPTTQT